ncbi:Hsp20 family protein [Pseudomonas amygdali]|uniref:Small heat shock protein n=2 Tax=Pseudomonas amygdali pv. lachrymans TaxID=53707 RepID=A0ABR5KSE0_PSEAV|nr:Hsp20 family protein [Pseudomonas amygdali]AXH60348.1 heat-shock protein Hsp20 [Pseudomonas amygdali pv. lachrymans str. M301315]KPC17736.1 putative small heat shock protein [Pseudomonas amygdali pv. lachrymans]RMT08686.1 putative small heat shock protein [Pseudomonas amygdali pv. lachrymans]
MQSKPFALHLFQLIDSLEILNKRTPNYPPMDIIKTGDDTVELHLAVAGFSPADIEVTTEKNILRVKGVIPESGEIQYIQHGIARRAFDHRFQLGENTHVDEGNFVNGLLKIKLKTIIPEEQKLKTINIG